MLRKIAIFGIFIAATVSVSRGQTNTFPSSGSVGIGTTSPISTLNVVDFSTHAPSLTVGSAASLAVDMSGTEIVFAEDGAPNYETYIQSKANWGVSSVPLSINPLGGNVGIGTTNPGSILDVASNVGGNGPWITVENVSAGTGGAFGPGIRIGNHVSGTHDFLINELQGLGSGFNIARPDSPYTQYFVIAQNGDVGIGTTSPGDKLEVGGNIKLSGGGAHIHFVDGTDQSTAWTGTLTGGDYAESMDVSGDREAYEPGDVLVLDRQNGGRVIKASAPYSLSVAGVYSTKPGLVGRRQKIDKKLATTEVPMAMVGVVPTKVSAENGAIYPGDVLVSSSTTGYAMKGTDRSLLAGAVVGKAMGTLEDGKGVIEVLISLQ